MRKRFISWLLVFCMAVCIVPAMAPEAQAAGNPYSYWQTFFYGGKNYTTVTCTWYVWQRVHDCLGIDLPAWGNAKDWLANASQYGYQIGTEPRVNSIVCWNNTGSYGHVGFVTAVNGNGGFTYDEGGSADRRRQDTVNGIYTGHPYPDGYTGKPDGYIYLDNASSSKPTTNNWSPSLDFGNDIYVYIKYSYDGNSSLYLKNDSSNATDYGKVSTGTWNGYYDSRFIWHCIHNGDSYWIENEYDGRRLDVFCGKDEDCTPIGLWPSNGATPQSWRFYKLPGLPASTFAMMPDSSNSRSRVADINNGSTAPGGELQLYTQNHSSAQCFSIYTLSGLGITYSKPAKPSAPQNIYAYVGSDGKTTISWSSVPTINKFDDRTYEILVDGKSYTTKSTSISLLLPAGSHSLKVCAVNTNYLDYKSAFTSKTISTEVPHTYTITVKASPDVGGIVSGNGTYKDSEFITVKAEPKFGYQFKEWQQNGRFVCNSPVFSFKTTENKELTAIFEKLPDTYVYTGWIDEPK